MRPQLCPAEAYKINADHNPAGGVKPGYKAPGYSLLDMSAWVKPTKNITIDAAVNNVLDKRYFHTLDVAWANGKKPSEASTQPGRNFSIGLNVEGVHNSVSA